MLATLTLALLLGTATPALAQSGDEAARAEYVRLSAEMKRLAEKNAWEGVERTFQRIQDLGIEPDYDDWFHAAQAARNRGDIGAVRERLLAANEIREEREVMDWLWEIDSSYGKTVLLAEPDTLELEPDAMPFHPDRAAAVQFAQQQILETGTFEGYLPEGSYTFGSYEVEVQPRVSTVRIDARGADLARKRKGKDEEPADEPVDEQPEEDPAVAEVEPEETVEPEEPQETARERRRRERQEARAEREREEALDEGEPQPVAGGGSPYLAGIMVGAGNNYGGIVGAGVQAVVRPGSGLFGISGGIGYDVEYTALGLSLNGRVYPHRNVYLGAGVAPMIWYRGVTQAPEGKVAHGPQILGGVDFLVGPVMIDATVGVGMAPAVGKMRPAVSGGAGIGIPIK